MSDLNPRERIAATLSHVDVADGYDIAGNILNDLTDDYAQALAEIREVPGYGAREAWAVVVALATASPTYPGHNRRRCVFCDARAPKVPEDHETSCTWRRARGLVDSAPTLVRFVEHE
jgi:hypothetical protein